MRILIIGATGTVGSRLSKLLKQSGHEVYGASRHIDPDDSTAIRLDLANTRDALEVASKSPKFDAVVLSAGITNLRECESKPELSRIVNVKSQVELARWFVQHGCKRIIFLSSNRVFDGTVAKVKSHANHSPSTEYGRQKSHAESQMLALGDAARVIRLTKILQEDSKLIAGWISKLRANQQIAAFSDVRISPISNDNACLVIEHLMTNSTPQIIQLSAPDEISYLEMARSIAEQLGVDRGIVGIQSAAEVGEKALLHSSLESSDLGLTKPANSLSIVRQIIERMVQI